MTPSQTVGPFFGFALPWTTGPCVVPEETPGAIRLRGRVLDGKGDPITDALLETWQADAEGRFAGGGAASWFRGFARCPTDREGRFAFVTVKPGAVRGGGAAVAAGAVVDAPHILLWLVARGLLRRVATRIYFADEADANANDPILARVADPALQATLIAAATDDGYRFDIRLQGEGETVFFDV